MPLPVAAIVGYTNAGKSTMVRAPSWKKLPWFLATCVEPAVVTSTFVGDVSAQLNRLTGKNDVFAEDKLFATLDPTTRNIQLPSGAAPPQAGGHTRAPLSPAPRVDRWRRRPSVDTERTSF